MMKNKSGTAKLLCALFGVLMLWPTVTQADDYLYQDDACEFVMTFPNEPYRSERCNPENPDDCQTLNSYTRVLSMQTSLNFKMTCSPVKENMFDRYSGDVMRATLEALARSNRVDEFKSYFKTYDNAKQAVVIGTGETGVTEKLYMAQMWIGRNSLMTVEGELIGLQTETAEKTFVSVMSSTRHKSWTQPEQEQKSDSQEDGDKESDSDKEDKAVAAEAEDADQGGQAEKNENKEKPENFVRMPRQ